MRSTQTVLLFACLAFASQAKADWYYYVMKVACSTESLRIIDYSAHNEEGLTRAADPGAIDVDKLSTWKTTPDDLNVPDKPLPHVTVCSTAAGKYRVTLTNAGGGYSAPYPIVNVREISNPQRPKVLFRNLSLERSYDYEHYEILFSRKHPKGRIVEKKLCPDC
jgi:hypothetical protein